MKKVFAIILAVLMLVTAFAACGEKTTGGTTGTGTGTGTSTGTGTGTSTGTGTGTGTGTTTPTETKKEPYGNFRTYFSTFPPTCNSYVDTNTPCGSINDWCQATLYTDRANEDMSGWHWICELAEDFPQKMDQEGKVWRVTFKKDLKWANGDKLDANDWIYSAKMFADPIQRNVSAAGWATSSNNFMKIVGIEDYFNGVEGATWDKVGIKQIDDYTIELTSEIKVPQVNVMREVDIRIVYQPLYDAGMSADKSITDYGNSVDKWNCSGAFKLVEWVPDGKMVLERNPNYVLADEVSLQNVTYVYANSATALQLFLSGDLDYVSISYADWERFEDDPRVYEYFNDSLMYYFVNHGNPTQNNILGNLSYRKALYYSINRQEIADTIGDYPATRFVRRSVVGNTLTGRPFVDYPAPYVKTVEESYNPELAVKYLNKAFEEKGLTSVSLEILQAETATSGKTASEMAQKNWMTIFGANRFTVTFNVVPSTITLRRWNPDNPTSFEVALGSLLPSATDPRAGMKFWISSYSPPRTAWNSQVFDDLYEQSILLDLTDEVEAEKIVDLCQQMEKIILDELVIIPVHEMPTKVLYSEKVHLPVDHYIVGYGFGEKLMTMDK